MVERTEKSTEAVQEVVFNSKSETVLLDSRLGLFEKQHRWLAVSDLHYGYEMTRRIHGGLWPLWGKYTLEKRLLALIEHYQPELVILNGDIVDSSAVYSDSKQWLHRIEAATKNLILIKGNHDRGLILRDFEFVEKFQIGSFLFHHGHQSVENDGSKIEVIGHIHPSFRYNDGAGLALKLPTLVQTENRWIMPAFSPWAGGVHYRAEKEAQITQWICSPARVFSVE